MIFLTYVPYMQLSRYSITFIFDSFTYIYSCISLYSFSGGSARRLRLPRRHGGSRRPRCVPRLRGRRRSGASSCCCAGGGGPGCSFSIEEGVCNCMIEKDFLRFGIFILICASALVCCDIRSDLEEEASAFMRSHLLLRYWHSLCGYCQSRRLEAYRAEVKHSKLASAHYRYNTIFMYTR